MTAGSQRLAAAGGILIVLGSLWAAIGLVLIVLATISLEPASLPEWVLLVPDAAGPQALAVALMGILLLVAGLGQLSVGLALAWRRVAWARWIGGGLALGGAAAMLTLALTTGGGPRPNLILAAVGGAYLFVSWAVLGPRRADVGD